MGGNGGGGGGGNDGIGIMASINAHFGKFKLPHFRHSTRTCNELWTIYLFAYMRAQLKINLR